MMKKEEAERINLAALHSTGDVIDSINSLLMVVLQDLLSAYPLSQRRLARLEAAVALTRGARGMLSMVQYVMDDVISGTEIEERAAGVDRLLNEAEKRVEQYVDAKREFGADEKFEEPQLLADIVQERLRVEHSNRVLDIKSKALQAALDEGLKVVAVTEDGSVIARPGLTNDEAMVS